MKKMNWISVVSFALALNAVCFSNVAPPAAARRKRPVAARDE